MTNDVFTLDENNNAAIRTLGVNPGSAETNSPSVFTEDENGNACIRVTGSGGGSVDESKVIVLSDTIPTADADSLGKFYCYKGITNASYTHGYVYECVAGSAYYEANIAFEKSTFASESFEKAGQLIVDAGVSDPTEVTGGTMTYALAGNLWSIVFTDANGDALNTAYSIYTDDLEQDYDILPVIDPSEFVDGQVVGMAINNVVEHHDYSWERVDLQPAAKLGRYLAGWNCATGLAMTNPPESPYEYTTGDYFIVGVVAAGGASNYKPNGSSYTTGVASSTVESESVSVNDTYLYDGTNWTLLKTGSTVTSVNGQTGDVSIGINDILPDQTGHSGHVLGTDGFVAGWVVPEKVQRSVIPQASEDEEGNIYQFVGTTDANYTNGYFYKCVSDGGNPATYSWERTDVQPGSSLPSQTGNAGKFLVTDGTNASWGGAVPLDSNGNVPIRDLSGSSLSLLKLNDTGAFINFKKTNNLLDGTIGQLSVYDGGLSFSSSKNGQVKSVFGTDETCFYAYPRNNSGADYDLGQANHIFSRTYTAKINNGGDITVPTVDGTLALQTATIPTAGSTYEGTIYQFTGTTDSTYTNGHFYKCVSDGQTPATYSWEEVQLGGGGGSYTAGTGIDITSGVISTVVPMGRANTSQSGESSIYFNVSSLADNKKGCVILGEWANVGSNAVTTSASIVIGNQTSGTSGSVAIGYHASTGLASYSAVKSNIAIGSYARIMGNTTHHAIQLGAVGNGTYSDNYDANTFKVANANGNFEIMSADGTIPADRLASTTGLADGNYRLRLTMANGVPTLSWVAE